MFSREVGRTAAHDLDESRTLLVEIEVDNTPANSCRSFALVSSPSHPAMTLTLPEHIALSAEGPHGRVLSDRTVRLRCVKNGPRLRQMWRSSRIASRTRLLNPSDSLQVVCRQEIVLAKAEAPNRSREMKA